MPCASICPPQLAAAPRCCDLPRPIPADWLERHPGQLWLWDASNATWYSLLQDPSLTFLQCVSRERPPVCPPTAPLPCRAARERATRRRRLRAASPRLAAPCLSPLTPDPCIAGVPMQCARLSRAAPSTPFCFTPSGSCPLAASTRCARWAGTSWHPSACCGAVRRACLAPLAVQKQCSAGRLPMLAVAPMAAQALPRQPPLTAQGTPPCRPALQRMRQRACRTPAGRARVPVRTTAALPTAPILSRGEVRPPACLTAVI